MLTEIRVRTRLHPDAMKARVQNVLTDADHDVRLSGPTRVLAPDGRPLAVYLPGAVREQMTAAYPILTTIRGLTENRGYASGTGEKFKQNNTMRAKPVMSSILGSFESAGFYKFCRLTSWTAKEMDARWPDLLPLWQHIGDLFGEYVPDRHAAQMKYAGTTQPDWMIPGTPFTTITVNNTFPTGVHKDAGDLDEGFSCLAVARRGPITGGLLTFPEYRVAVDMQDGDLILMDAHAWHGNTLMHCACPNPAAQGLSDRKVLAKGPCAACGAERISTVCYFRTNMVKCSDASGEQEKAVAWGDRWNQPREGDAVA